MHTVMLLRLTAMLNISWNYSLAKKAEYNAMSEKPSHLLSKGAHVSSSKAFIVFVINTTISGVTLLIYLHSFADCFMKISPQSSEQMQYRSVCVPMIEERSS